MINCPLVCSHYVCMNNSTQTVCSTVVGQCASSHSRCDRAATMVRQTPTLKSSYTTTTHSLAARSTVLPSLPPIFFISSFPCLAVWLSGNALVSINEVTLRRARLVLEWVTVSGIQLSVRKNLGMSCHAIRTWLSMRNLLS